MPPDVDCDLTLRIEASAYNVEPLPGGFSLRKHAAPGLYFVTRSSDGIVQCTCPNYRHVASREQRSCKHGRALVAKGLMPGVVAPESERDESLR